MSAFLIGAGLTVAFMLVSRAIGLHRERGVWVTTLVAIALFYVVFAVQAGGRESIIFHIIIASGFIGMALYGFAKSLWWVVLALALHGAFDLAGICFEASPAPVWWGPLCFAVDVLLAASLAVWLKRNTVSARPASAAQNGQPN